MSPEDIFGKVTPPPGSGSFSDPVQGVSSILVNGIKLFLIMASLFMLGYMLWGALDWIISSGEKERVAKAQNKIQNAVIGLFVIVISFALFSVITGPVLHIIDTSNGWSIKLPTLK